MFFCTAQRQRDGEVCFRLWDSIFWAADSLMRLSWKGNTTPTELLHLCPFLRWKNGHCENAKQQQGSELIGYSQAPSGISFNTPFYKETWSTRDTNSHEFMILNCRHQSKSFFLWQITNENLAIDIWYILPISSHTNIIYL